MSSTVLKWSAVVLVISGVLLTWMAFQLAPGPDRQSGVATEQADKADSEQPVERFNVVVAARSLEANETIAAEHVQVESLTIAAKGTFESVDEVIGRRVAGAVRAGESITERHFGTLGKLASQVPAGKRAMAVPINDVSGVAGFVEPGDRVDLIAFFPRGAEVSGSQARVLFRNLTVLAFGRELDHPDVVRADTAPNTSASTAVLAVPADAVTRLTVGVSTGTLRLALRGPDEDPENGQLSEDDDIERTPLSDMVDSDNDTSTVRDVTGERPEPPGPRTRVHRGGQTEEIQH